MFKKQQQGLTERRILGNLKNQIFPASSYKGGGMCLINASTIHAPYLAIKEKYHLFNGIILQKKNFLQNHNVKAIFFSHKTSGHV